MNSSDIEAPDRIDQTAAFESMSIYNALGRIGSQTRPLYLPAIQRHFVWKMDQFSELFDSLMRGYPIGTFLFWEVEDERRHDYAFYEFIRQYSQYGDGWLNRTAPRNLPRGVTGVLDGQQRLNSMYAALLGSYAPFIGGRGHSYSRKADFPERHFHLNVLFEPNEEDDLTYRFRFLTEPEASVERFSSEQAWFPVSFIYHCESSGDIEVAWNDFVAGFEARLTLSADQHARALAMLKLLWRRIHEERLITYFPIRNRDLTEALRIFIRANNGGTRVSDAEMIFSTIVAHWPEGRKKIEGFNYTINQVGNGFNFEVTHIMLACLALAGCPVRLRIESFKPAHVDVIREQWEDVVEFLRTAAQLAADWGLSGNNAVNPHAIIALALLPRAGVAETECRDQLRLFVLKFLVCRLYQRGERRLTLVRNYANSHLLPGSRFDLRHFESVFILPSGQRMEITRDELENLLMLPISDARAYVLLTLLHGQHALHQKAFDVDHIHPRSGFADLGQYYLGPEREASWHDWKDRLPNLQLLQDGENNQKRAKPFKDWLPLYRPHDEARRAYLAENDIPAEGSLDFADFEAFFEQRKDRLRQKLLQLLNVPPPSLSIAPDHSGDVASEELLAESSSP